MFGKYLVERGLLTEEQLLEALEQQRTMRPSIGRLALEHRLLDLDQVVEVIERQATSPMRFCALAVELGFLTPAQREELLVAQSEAHTPLGQVLAATGALPIDVLEDSLERYLERGESTEEE